MSAVLQSLPVLNTQHPYMLKDNAVGSYPPAFTTINRKDSPPTPPGSIRSIGMSARQSPPQHPEHRPSEGGYRSGADSSSPDSSSSESSPDSPKRRKRSGSPEENAGADRGMEAPQHRPLPPIDRPSEHERRWTAEPPTRNGYPELREPHPAEPSTMPPMAVPHAPGGELNGFEPGSSSDPNRTGVQHIDPKKRKRQFANRTKTGCGTCRRRKKKCDEAKPECTSTSLVTWRHKSNFD
jgi:hypothetical protein